MGIRSMMISSDLKKICCPRGAASAGPSTYALVAIVSANPIALTGQGFFPWLPLATAVALIGAAALGVHAYHVCRRNKQMASRDAELQHLFEGAADPIYIHEIHPDGTMGSIIQVNEAACRTLGYSHEELLLITPAEIDAGPEDEPLETLVEELKRKKTARFDRFYRRKDGSLFPVEANAQVLNQPNRDLVMWIVRDVSLRCEQEERLLFLASILDATDDAIIGTTPDGLILSWNQGAERLYGFPEAVMIGHDVADLLATDDREALQALYAKVLSKRIVTHTESALTLANGGFVDISVTLGPILGRHGEVEGIAFIARDVTEWKRAEEEARVRQQQLVQAEKLSSLGVLVGGVAHELNNPNSYIAMNVYMLKDIWNSVLPILDQYHAETGDFVMAGLPYSKMRERVPELFEAMEEGSDRIKYIVRELREFARQTPDDLLETVNLNQVVESAMTLLTSMLKKATHHLEVEFGKDLPSLQGNYRRIEQVIINLLQNACQALADRDRRVWVTTFADPKQHQVVLTVADEGCGIKPSDLPRVMDPFFTTKRDAGHSGLGLSVCATIIQDHQGQLTFESTLGKGTAATLRLPVPRDRR